MYWGPRFLYERYKLPIVITENGHQNADDYTTQARIPKDSALWYRDVMRSNGKEL